MSQAEALLNRMAGSSAYAAPSTSEPHIVIDKDRFITVPKELARLGVQFDHDIETVTFDCPRYWDDHDMSTMRIYINYMRADNAVGVYAVKNVTVDSFDDTIMHFDWVISKNVTMAAGNLTFLVCIKRADEDGNEENHWNSELCQDAYISKGLAGAEMVVEDYPDIIAQMEEANQVAMARIKAELLAAKDAGEFNPNIIIEDISGGHLVTFVSGPFSKTFEVLDGNTSSIRTFMSSYVAIGETEPTRGPAMWFDKSGQENEDAVVMKYKDANGTIYVMKPVTDIDNVDGFENVLDHVSNKNNPHNVTLTQLGGAPKNHDHPYGKYVTTAGTGAAYTATVEGITNLTAGISFIIIPHTVSTSKTPSLNINGLGSASIRRRRSTSTGVAADGYSAGWLEANKPVRVTYDGIFWIADIVKTVATDLEGTVPVVSGGTGKNTWTANGLIYASSANSMAQMPIPTEADCSILSQDTVGAPKWLTPEALALAVGATRLAMGTYTGTGNSGNRDLGVTPKLLFIYAPGTHDGSDNKWKILYDGYSESYMYEGYDYNQNKTWYYCGVQLSGRALVFTRDKGDAESAYTQFHMYLNQSGATYRWFALY